MLNVTTCVGNCCSPGCPWWCLWWCLSVLSFFSRDVLGEILDLSQFLRVFLPTLGYKILLGLMLSLWPNSATELFLFCFSEHKGPTNAPHKIPARYSRKCWFYWFCYFKYQWPSWILDQTKIYYSEALQSGHSASEICVPWVQWFQRISHFNGLNCMGKHKL